jgi:hypothetical protein
VIQLTCAQCKATLEVDDAFAGGVCRCQYCGTIQTVPRPGARPRSPDGTSAVRQGQANGTDEPKALYQVKSRTGLSSAPSGLEELAEVVHSSGLSGSGLLNRSHARLSSNFPKTKTKSPAKSNRMLWIGIGSGVGLLLAVTAALLLSPGAKENVVTNPDGTPQIITDTTTPNFGGIELSGDKVIFIIDRGDATATYFPAIKTMTTRAVKALGADRRFQVILWDNGQQDAYPKLAADYGRDDEVDRLSRWFDEVSTGQSTDALPAMKAAMQQSPDTIVLVTGKADQLAALSPTFTADILNLRGGKTPVIHTVSLGNSDPDDPLKKIALESAGQHKVLTKSALNALSQ